MKKFVKILVIILGFLLPVGYAMSIDTGVENVIFSGSGHTFTGGCHSDSLTFSAGGSIELSSSAGTSVNLGDTFNVSIAIKGFMEAAGGSIFLKFSSPRGDNGDFSFTPDYKDNVGINVSGNSAPTEFTVTAPTTEGVYIITVDALYDPSGGDPLDWTFGSLEITVSNSTENEAVDPFRSLYIISGTMAGVVLAVSFVFLSTRFVKNTKLSKERELVGFKK